MASHGIAYSRVIRRWIIGALVALFAVGCRPAKMPPTEVVSYGVSHFSGTVWFVVRSDGTAEYAREHSGDDDVHVHTRVRPEELDALVAAFRKHQCCTLRSLRKHGVPDEAHPNMAVRTGGIDCRFGLWDNEFRERPRAKACLAAVEGLGSALRARGAPSAAPTVP